MANSLGSLTLSMALESAQFIAGLRSATAASNNAANAINKSMGLIKGGVATLAAAFSVDFIAGHIQSAFDYADAIQDLSDRTGVSTKFIQEFGYAAQLSGSSVESARGGLEKFAKNLGEVEAGNKGMAQTFAKLGITSRDTDTAVRQAADGIKKLKTPAEQAAATTSLFGKKAQDLTVTMAGGSAGLSEFAQKAANLGIVLDGDLISNAGKVNDELDTLKMIVTAEMASAIVKNADAIHSLADGVVRLVTALAQFWAKDPTKAMTIMGAIGGGLAGFMVGGPVGALAGGAAGAYSGYKLGHGEQQARYENNYKWGEYNRREQYATKQAEDTRIISNSEHNTSPEAAATVAKWARDAAYYKSQRERIEAGINNGTIVTGAGTATPKKPVDPRGALPTGATEKKQKGPTAEELAKKEADRVFDFERDVAKSNSDLMRAKAELTSSVEEQAKYELAQLDEEHITKKTELNKAIRDGKIKDTPSGKNADGTDTEATQLRTLEDQIFYAKAELVRQKRDEEIDRQKLEVKQAGLTNEIDINNGSLELARGTKVRRDITLRLVDLQFQQEKLTLEAVLASKQSTDTEKEIARKRLALLPTLKDNADQSARQSTQSPMEAYLDKINKTGGEINDDLETVGTQGLDNLQTGLLGIIKGTQSVGDAFSSMADTIVDGLLKIALEQAIIKPLGSLLFGGGDNGGSGIFGSVLMGITGAIKGKRANGGLTRSGDYLVGERGPEVVSIGNTANVTTNRELQRDDKPAGNVINFGPITSNDPAMVRALVVQGIAQAMPTISNQAMNTTLTKARRPSL